MEDIEKKKSHLLTVLMMIDADDDEHAHEVRFIYEVGERYGFSPDEVDELRKNPYDIGYELPTEEVERMNLLYDMFFTMKIDGSINEDEANVFRTIGKLMGFNQLMLEDFIQVARQYVGQPIPEQALLNIIRKYMN